MKSLNEYIADLNTTYTFRVKMAKQDPSKMMEQIKSALETYELVSVTNTTRTCWHEPRVCLRTNQRHC